MSDKEKVATDPEKDLIERVEKNLKKSVAADDHNRQAGVEDLKFANGEHWNAGEKKTRSDEGRPCLTINLLPKFIEQVVGDMLHNTPSIRFKPAESGADINIAKIRQGIVSDIEYQSNSKGIYGYAARQMVTCGFGAWRVLTRYTEENPFIQEIYLEGIRNPFLVYMDPSAKDQNYADARWGIIAEKMSQDDFEERYPDAMLPSDALKLGKGVSDENWYNKGDNTITVAEYFEKTTEKVDMVQLEDGRVMTEDEYKSQLKEWKKANNELFDAIEKIGVEGPAGGGDKTSGQQSSPVTPNAPPPNLQSGQGAGQMPSPSVPPAAPGQPPMPPAPTQMPPKDTELNAAIKNTSNKPVIANKRKTEKTVIRHWVLSCMEILEGGVDGDIVAGKYIPLILLKGKELNIEGKNYIYSLIRHAKDTMKMINYWHTAAAEAIALAPKAPWVGTAKQFEGYEEDYASANVKNLAMLKYNSDDQAPGPPQRQNPTQPPSALFEQIRKSEDNLKSVLGMFNADVGAGGSQQTGAAVNAVQKPGDIATFEFQENLARAIMFTGKVINEMIPDVYDTERDVRIRNIDEAESFVPVNTTVGSAMKSVADDPDKYSGLDHTKLRDLFSKNGKDAKFNDVTAGKYSVVVTVGPSYATQRQESAQQLLSLVQSMPQQMGIAADLIVENMDFKAADELAARLRKALPPNMAKPRPGEAPPAPVQPPPQVLLAQAKVENEKLKGETAKAKIELEKIKIQKESSKQPEPPDPKVQIDFQLAQLNLQLQKMKADMEQQRLMHEDKASNDRASLEQQRLAYEVEKQKLTLQIQREAHIAKMQEMDKSHQLKMEESKNKAKDPLGVRK